MDSQRVEEEIAAALASGAAERFDVDGNGVVGPYDEALLRRVIENELRAQQAAEVGQPTLARTPRLLDDRWLLCGLLGRGGQAATYLALDQTTGTHVAVKELDLGRVDDWKSVELFEREAAALERLEHPQIPKYIAHFSREEDGRTRFYLVQEFVGGFNLAEELERSGPLSEKAGARLRDRLFDILEYLHGLNPPVVHRDIKPANLINDGGKLVLVDFGAVQSAHAKTAGGSTVVGTAGYMPMEQYMGRAVPASDIYAVGATLAHLMTGRSPTELPVENNRLQTDGLLKVLAPFANGLHRMLEPAVEKRPQTVAEARDGFRVALVAPPASEPKEEKRKLGLVPMAAIALLIAGGGAYAYTEYQKDPANYIHVENLTPTPPAGAKKVLFVGNSHVYWWDQPRLVAQVVPEGQPPLWFDVFAWPGANVLWHVEHDVGDVLDDEKWAAVVLQPQSVEPALPSDAFGAGMAKFEQLVPNGTRSIVWVPWARDKKTDIHGVYKTSWSGGNAAELTHRLENGVRAWVQKSDICPLGEAFLRVRKQLPKAPVIDERDGNKATHVGAYLNAVMLYSCIYKRDPAEVTFVPKGLDAGAAAKLRAIASQVGKDYHLY